MLTSRKKFLQQSAFALAGTCLPLLKLFARDFNSKTVGDTYHPVDCSIDLATEYKYSLNQIAVGSGFYSSPYDDGINPPNTINPFDNDVMYALEGNPPDAGACNPTINDCSNLDFGGNNPFRYKVYYPKVTVHNYDAKPLPTYIFFHAGGFQECPSYELPLIRNLCEELSLKGFICFTVEYRRGRIKDTDPTKVSVQQQLARYRAIQDGCGAIRSIMKKNRPSDPQKFDFIIDENQVFLGGTSAGGIIAMGCAYYRTSADLVTDQSMIDATFPKAAGSTYNIKQTLGKMHANYYYSSVNSQNWPKIAGVANLWGGIVIPKNKDSAEPTFFQSDEPGANPPLIAFHGDNDLTIPFNDDFGQDMDLSPPIGAIPDYNSENFCTNSGNTYIQKSVPGVELKMCSSLNMFRVLRELDRFTELYVDCSMGHGLDSDCITCDTLPNRRRNAADECVPCAYTSNFGTTATNQLQTTVYMAARIAVFSQAIMAAYPSVLTFGAKGRAYFKDCENSRTCNQPANHACGSGGLTLCDDNLLFE